MNELGLKKALEQCQGKTLQKGRSKRPIVEFDGTYVYYNTPGSKGIRGEHVISFSRWLEKATLAET